MMDDDNFLLPQQPLSSMNYDLSDNSSASFIIRQQQLAHQQQQQLSKYSQLLSLIEEMGKDIRPSYAGSKSSGERLKRALVHARLLVRECLMETERSASTGGNNGGGQGQQRQ